MPYEKSIEKAIIGENIRKQRICDNRQQKSKECIIEYRMLIDISNPAQRGVRFKTQNYKR